MSETVSVKSWGEAGGATRQDTFLWGLRVAMLTRVQAKPEPSVSLSMGWDTTCADQVLKTSLCQAEIVGTGHAEKPHMASSRMSGRGPVSEVSQGLQEGRLAASEGGLERDGDGFGVPGDKAGGMLRL